MSKVENQIPQQFEHHGAAPCGKVKDFTISGIDEETKDAICHCAIMSHPVNDRNKIVGEGIIPEEIKNKIPNAFWVCDDCGNTFGARPKEGKNILSTYHLDICDICNKDKNVTEFRDFGWEKKI